MGSYILSIIESATMLKQVIAICLLFVVVKGSDYGYGGYGYGGGYNHGYGYGGYGYGGYGSYGGGYGHGYGYGYGYPSYGYGYPSYGYGYDYPSYGYGHGGSGYKYKRSVGQAEQVHVSGATGQTVVSPSHAYGSAPAYGSHAPSSYAPHSYAPHSYAPYSYAPHYPRYSGLYTYPYVTATNAVFSSYPTPSRHGYSSHGYGNVGYATPTSFLYSPDQGYGPQGEVDGHYVAPYAYAPHHYPSYY